MRAHTIAWTKSVIRTGNVSESKESKMKNTSLISKPYTSPLARQTRSAKRTTTMNAVAKRPRPTILMGAGFRMPVSKAPS